MARLKIIPKKADFGTSFFGRPLLRANFLRKFGALSAGCLPLPVTGRLGYQGGPLKIRKAGCHAR